MKREGHQQSKVCEVDQNRGVVHPEAVSLPLRQEEIVKEALHEIIKEHLHRLLLLPHPADNLHHVSGAIARRVDADQIDLVARERPIRAQCEPRSARFRLKGRAGAAATARIGNGRLRFG